MVEPTENGALADGTIHFPCFTGFRDLLLNPLMRSLTVMEGDVLLENPLDLSSANKQKIVQCFSSEGPEEPSPDAVHVRRLHARLNRYESVPKKSRLNTEALSWIR
jgi:hypothetical protein